MMFVRKLNNFWRRWKIAYWPVDRLKGCFLYTRTLFIAAITFVTCFLVMNELQKISHKSLVESGETIMRELTIQPNAKKNQRVLVIHGEQLKRDSCGMILHALHAFHIQTVVSDVFPEEEEDLEDIMLVIITDVYTYIEMPDDTMKKLKQFCRKDDIPMLIFTLSAVERDSRLHTNTFGFPFDLVHVKKVDGYKFNPSSLMYDLIKPEHWITDEIPQNWIGFVLPNPNKYPERYRPLAFVESENPEDKSKVTHIAVLEDTGVYDKVRRIFVGHDLDFWAHHLFLIDALQYLTRGKIKISYKRWISIDIDDVFIGKEGARMNLSDFEDFMRMQRHMQSYMPGFKFNLGYCSEYFYGQTPEDVKVTEIFLENRDKFWWFDHSFSHIAAYDKKVTPESYHEDLRKNREIGRKHGIDFFKDYIIMKAHAGIFPVIDFVYEEYKNLGVKVSATCMAVPRTRNGFYRRRGFVYRNISVLPRYALGVSSTEDKFEDISLPPGGFAYLHHYVFNDNIQHILYSVVAPFFAHFRNFKGDRIGSYSIETSLEAIRKYTNLELDGEHPVQLAERYFKEYPEDIVPMWTDPCRDKKAEMLWANEGMCDKFPNMILIGPEKTGSSALQWLLSKHPDVKFGVDPNDRNKEMHFFDGTTNYLKGINWYVDMFAKVQVPNCTLVERTSSYFHTDITPQRMGNLIPKAKIIITLKEPAIAAYDTYLDARESSTSDLPEFYNVITADNNSPPHIQTLRDKCLYAGKYHRILIDRWRRFYSNNKIIIVDTDALFKDPVESMAHLQEKADFKHIIDYGKVIKVESNDGTICDTSTSTCVKNQASKIDSKSLRYLRDLYKKNNVRLQRQLRVLNIQKVPQWAL